MVKPFKLFAVAAPGLEKLLAQEIRDVLGNKAINITEQVGGVLFSGHRDALFRSNFELRLPSRILVRVGKFEASDNDAFVRGMLGLDWSRFLFQDGMRSVDLTKIKRSISSRSSKLFHTGMIDNLMRTAFRVLTDGNFKFVSGQVDYSKPGEVDHDESFLENTQHIVVSIVRDTVHVSISSSGEHLHKRLYRQREHEARMPLKETAAAALYSMVNFQDGEEFRFDHILDPFCGTATLPIEGALIASKKAPGLVRMANISEGKPFAFQNWPCFEDPEPFNNLVKEQKEKVVSSSPAKPKFYAFDRDPKALSIARRCAERAGVSEWIQFETRSIESLRCPELSSSEKGLLLTNPPFGPRSGDTEKLSRLYSSFGSLVRKNAKGYEKAILSPSAGENRSLVYRTALSGTWSEPFLLGPRRMTLFRST